MPSEPSIQRVLENVPSAFRCPGGAVAVIKDGELAGQHVWGYANLDARIPMTSQTIFPICSISKQMVCLILTDLLEKDKDRTFEIALDDALHELLPHYMVSQNSLELLVAMQSGLRDYWALTVLWGATPGDRFSIYEDAPKALKRLGDFHFPPGTQMSYSNSNFMVVGLAIEKATGQSLDDLLRSRLFKPAGMTTAALRADMDRLPPPCVGYEGSETSGYIAYRNRIEWAGDAGISASLEDMIAYEKYVDHSSSTDPESVYCKNAREPRYDDGSAANYGYGLMHGDVDGTKVVTHGGALAGFRLNRLYAAEKRTSVVVMLNSEMDAGEIAEHVLKKMIAEPPVEDQQSMSIEKVEVGWAGHYLDEETNLAIAVKQEKAGQLLVNYRGYDDKLTLSSVTQAASKNMEVGLENDKLSIHRTKENRRFTARSLASRELQDTSAYTGSYRSEEIDSTFHCSGGGGDMLYSYFDGYLGKGPVHVMRHIGEEVWFLECHRSLDATAPGKWTVLFHRNDDGEGISGVTVGCWLARNILFKKVK